MRIRVSDTIERNHATALSEMAKISGGLSLPKSVLETASVVYRKAVKRRLTRERSIQGISAASVYVACRQCGLARMLDEIADASKVNTNELGRCYRFMIKNLNIFIPNVRPNQYISKFSNQLIMQSKTEEIAGRIFVSARQLCFHLEEDP